MPVALPKWLPTLPTHTCNPIIPVVYVEQLPIGCVTAESLLNLARTLSKLESWYRRHSKKHELPCLRLIQGSRDGRITALVQVGEITLKLQLKSGEWVVLGDALKVSD
jgi:hypothetical protein